MPRYAVGDQVEKFLAKAGSGSELAWWMLTLAWSRLTMVWNTSQNGFMEVVFGGRKMIKIPIDGT